MVVGCLDIVTRDRIAGWAWDDSDTPVTLEIVIDDVVVATTLANGARPDVVAAGASPHLRCGFHVVLPRRLSPRDRHGVVVRRTSDALPIADPFILEPTGGFDDDLAALISRLAATADGDDRHRLLRCLTDAATTLRAAGAAEDSGGVAEDELRLRQQRDERTSPVPRPRCALVIDGRWPRRDAGSQALLSHIAALTDLGYQVSLTAADEINVDPPPMAIDATLGVQILSSPRYASVEEILRLQRDRFDLVYLHREANATRYLGLARRLQRRARILYSVADLHGLRLHRQGAVEGRPELEARGRLLLRDELRAASCADAVITHSTAEAGLLARHGIAPSRIHVVPWAVPVASIVPPAIERSGLLFVGNFAHAPNLDAARWLLDEILPLVWQRSPDLTCTLIGDEMPAELLGRMDPRVRLLPGVADIAAPLAQARLSVAPLRFGAGIKGKVLEAVAAGLPCVMTPVAAEGLDLPQAFSVLVADGAAASADAVLRHYDDPDHLDMLGRLGRDWIGSACGADRVWGLLAKALR